MVSAKEEKASKSCLGRVLRGGDLISRKQAEPVRWECFLGKGLACGLERVLMADAGIQAPTLDSLARVSHQSPDAFSLSTCVGVSTGVTHACQFGCRCSRESGLFVSLVLGAQIFSVSEDDNSQVL